MSSSFLKRLALLSLLAIPTAWAQQNYFIPAAEVTAERNTNRELFTNSAFAEDSNAYKATFGARTGRVTPRSLTEVRPRIVLQEFPDREGVDPVELLLDLRHDYRTVKGRFSVIGRYRHQDTINTEFGNAVVDDDGDPTTPPVADDDSGIVFVGQTRQTFSLSPNVEYLFTQRWGLRGNLQYEAVRYEEVPVSDRVGYDSPRLEVSLLDKVGPRTSLTFGPYVAYYEADDNGLPSGGGLKTDTYGMRFGVEHEWSEVSQVVVSLLGERNESRCQCLVPLVSGSTTDWGLEVLGFRRTRVGSISYGIGRFLIPSTLGTRRKSDQIQFQYDRLFSEKLSFRGAVRLTRDEAVGISASGESGDRDRVRTELSLTRLMTPTWYIGGGYRFAWQDLSSLGGDQADNHGIFINVGYRGRDPRRDIK
jgi:hypothetical protein